MGYPEIEKLGLKAERSYDFMANVLVVDANDLEKLLGEAPTVYGYEHKDGYTFSQLTSDSDECPDTHTAKLLCIQPIKREPMRVEFVSEYDADGYFSNEKEINKIAKPLRGKRVRVTIEEVGGE